MKWIDLPPVWLLAAIGLAWASPLRMDAGWAVLPGWGLIGVGVVLTVLAVLAFLGARTTISPRKAPRALITGGIFRVTRNPIYLADALFLAGLSLIWGSVIGVVLVPLFVGVIQRRFVLGEEARLAADFGDAFVDYARTTRRWI